MSTVYSTEPATTGRVVLDTTHGPIDINLWCKECPTTTRTFIQLCLDGYYDGMIFHRILSEFLIQTGLTRTASIASASSASEIDGYLRQSTAVSKQTNGTNISGDVLGLDRKKLEINPRIRFNHRGQVAMAFPLEETSSSNNNNNADEEESKMLRYQFFTTLDEAPFLDAKHVVFGTIAGATMFNALRIGRTDADDQTGIPTDMSDAPPRIKSIKVDFHPFEDMVITSEKKIPWKKDVDVVGKDGKSSKQSTTLEKRKKKRKGKRDLNVLSFGDEERNYDDEISSSNTNGNNNKKKKMGSGSMMSSHDVLAKESKFLSSEVDADVDKRIKAAESVEAVAPSEEKQTTKIQSSYSSSLPYVNKNEIKAISDIQASKAIETSKKQVDTKEDSEKGSKPKKSSKGMSALDARRAKYLKPGSKSSANKKKREDDTMSKLLAFRSKMIDTKVSKSKGSNEDTPDDSLAARMAKRVKQTKDDEEKRIQEEEAIVAMPGYIGQVNQEEYDNDDTKSDDWMSSKFKCKRHIDNEKRKGDSEMGGDGRRMDEYVVLDEKRNKHKGDRNGGRSHRHR